MALPDSEQPDKRTEPHKGPEKKERFLTKVVIRRLPPSMNRETFLNQISPVPAYDYFYMVKGDASLGENAFARAYINFTIPNDIYDFKEKFDNYVFLDNAGHEYPAVVEFAAFQKIPKRRNKVRLDPKVGTIESDPYYLEFVEMINKPRDEIEEKPEYSYQLTTENKNDTMTPLLEFVKHKRAERMRIREERREERKKKEFERKKVKDDERKKRFDDKSPAKPNKFSKVTSPKDKIVEEEDSAKADFEDNASSKNKPTEEPKIDREEKYDKGASSYYKGREKKYDDRKRDPKPKYPPKKEYSDKRDYKGRRDEYKEREYRPKYEDFKKDDVKTYQKKVKKYSEKREERKIEAQKAEQKKLEQQTKQQETPKTETTEISKSPEDKKEKKEDTSPAKAEKKESPSKAEKSRSRDEAQKRIRNKDRPTIAIYRPGMLSKRRQSDGGEGDGKDNDKKE